MAVLDHGNEIVVGLNFAGKLVPHDVDEVMTREEPCGVSIVQPFLGEKHQGNHDQRHVMMPSLPASDLIVGHATRPFGILESTLHKVAISLHAGQSA